MSRRETGAPIMTMSWHDLLFLHWPMPVEALRPLVPAALTIDTFDGSGWLGVVPFRMTRVRPLGLPLPGDRFAFAEINVRTYVTLGGRPGVWFLSLHGGDALAALVARLAFGIPYFRARVSSSREGDGVVFASRRPGPPPAEFRARYRPSGPVWSAPSGTLEHFLTNRLCLYATDRTGRIRRADIEHGPWPLQDAEVEISLDTMAASHGLALPDVAPVVHFARRLDVVGRRAALVPGGSDGGSGQA
ncbi:DUF2071 domain-containing protein [soil metagenome]